MKIGLYGGAFDPIHLAHLSIARHIQEELELDKVIFIPSAAPPHKRVFIPALYRFEMVKLAIADDPGFEYSDVEIRRGGTSYSVDTIVAFKRKSGLTRDHLFWLMGSDNFICLDKWKDPNRIIKLCKIAVFPRNKVEFDLAPAEYRKHAHYFNKAPLIDISSSKIRELVTGNRSIHDLVPAVVEKYILKNKLYI